MLRDGVLFIGFGLVAICVIAAFAAVVYFMRQEQPPSNCRVDDKGIQRISFPESDRVYVANVTITYCNLKPEGAE